MENKENLVIGVLGGMGTYATINLFKQYAAVFSAEKEWERPRLIIDNRCTMPSRVRAFLYNENVDELVSQMAESIGLLMNAGGEHVKILLACNTSHLFLNAVFEKLPTAKSRIVNIIEECSSKIKNDNSSEVYLLASEGTIESGIYQKYLKEYGIKCLVPEKWEYAKLRTCIEAVKQNTFTEEVENVFIELVNRNKNCILGCTELPVLYDLYKSRIKSNTYDPCLIALEKIKKEYYSE